MIPKLLQDFEKTAVICDAETQALSGHLRRALLQSSCCAVPLWDPQNWPSHGPHNCYNFALNSRAVPVAFPGMHSAPIPLGRYYFSTQDMHEAVHNGAVADGLLYLGEHFFEAAQAQDIAPVALFLRPPPYLDFHWVSLRRDERELFWAQVPGAGGAAMRLQTSIFNAALEGGYDKFAGYYGVPLDKEFKNARRSFSPATLAA